MSASSQPTFFKSNEETYLIAQLVNGEEQTAIKALQWLCQKLREGTVFVDSSKIVSVIRGCLYRPSSNCRRWAVNALTELRAKNSADLVLGLIPTADDDPDLLASVVAYMFAANSEKSAEQSLLQHGLEIEGPLLIAASQFSRKQKRRLVENRIPLDKASPEEFRAAIVLTGVGKAPEHLFHERHTNALALSELNLHDVASVSKYSIWAQARLKLGFSSLNLPIENYESSEPQIRKWIARLLVSDPVQLKRELDFFDACIRDDEDVVRLEIALELRENYIPEISGTVLRWAMSEADEEIRSCLILHMAAFADQDEDYFSMIEEIYKNAPQKSDVRNSIEAACAKTAVYTKLRRISWEQEGTDLFANDNFRDIEGEGNIIMIEQKFNNSSIGAISNYGDISAETIQGIQGVESQDIKNILEKSMTLLAALDSKKQTEEGQDLVASISKSPKETGLWVRFVKFLKEARDGVGAATEIGEQVNDIIGQIGSLSDFSGIV